MVAIELIFGTSEEYSLSLILQLAYKADGIWFSDGSGEVPDITCSVDDSDWKFELPEVGASD